MPTQAETDRLQALLQGLNEPQREAVTHGEGPMLILAGAGSGKTRVLTHRIAFLLFSGQARPFEVLAITFTNKAATEMRERVEKLIGARTRGMWLMTFHSACARILRANAELLGYTNTFTIYDQTDSKRLVKRCLEEAGVDIKRFTPAAVQSRISAAKNKLLDAQGFAEVAAGPFEELVAEVYKLYEQEIQRMNAMDFDDLLLLTVQLLELHPQVRERYASTFKHVLVDEYQDTNHAQYRLLQLLVGGGARPARGHSVSIPGHRNLAVVGDDAQSIYSFRGADVSNILDFEQDFPDARVVKLEQNYRSTQSILSAANVVISHNSGGLEKQLWSDLGEGEPIHVRSLPDEHSEARFIVGEIQRLLDEGASRSEIAILYRTNAMSRPIEDTLMRREIAYQVIGGTRFYERAEVKDAIAYLTLLSNPQDVTGFQRIVNSPKRGIGQASVAKVLAHASSTGASVWEVASRPSEVPGLGPAAVKSLSRFITTMAELRELAETDGPVGELLHAVLQKTGYVEALTNERTFEAQGRIENLEQLIDVGHEYDDREWDAVMPEDAAPEGGAVAAEEHGPATDEGAAAQDGPSRAPEGSLQLFLQEIALLGDADSRKDDEGLVTVMTLHNAKGLEYPIVFVAGCEEGVFPHSRSIDAGDVEEERRLFYVGVTRAMKELYLTHARRRRLFGESTYSPSSSFLEEIPDELIDFDEEADRELPGFGSAGGASRPRFGGADLFAARMSGPPTARRQPRGTGQTPSFRLGDDVVHASFGEGVVTGVEPDGVIVVRFAKDGSERKLMAEYAPVSRR